MKDIFTDLYKKVLGFFQTQEKEAVESKTVAVNRMKLVLMQDRTNLTPYLLERMRGELVELLSRYVEMDKDALELNFAQEGDSTALMLSIPVVRAKDEAEIEAMIKAEDEAKAKAEEEENAITEEEVSEESEAEEKTEVCTEDEEVSDESESGLVEVCACTTTEEEAVEASENVSETADIEAEEEKPNLEETSSKKSKKKN